MCFGTRPPNKGGFGSLDLKLRSDVGTGDVIMAKSDESFAKQAPALKQPLPVQTPHHQENETATTAAESSLISDLTDDWEKESTKSASFEPDVPHLVSTKKETLTQRSFASTTKSLVDASAVSIADKRRAIQSLRLDIQKRLDRFSQPNGSNQGLVDHENQASSLAPFNSHFKPQEMRCLALVAHKNMKPAMKTFIESHSELLKKFRLMGTSSTMAMMKSVYGCDPTVVYGPACSSCGCLSSDAQLAAQICLGDVGGVIFFMDPLSSSQTHSDVDAIVSMSNVHNVLLMQNPSSAIGMSFMLRQALKEGRKEMIPSFFVTCQSPAVKEYKKKQEKQHSQHFFDSMLDVAVLLRIYSPKPKY